MDLKFKDFSFSAFMHHDINGFKEVIQEIFYDDMTKGTFSFIDNQMCIEEYIDVSYGQKQNEMFSFWKTSLLPSVVFFSSNSLDGRYALCNAIHNRMGCTFILCNIHKGSQECQAGYIFHYTDANNNERDILAYKDSKWVFCQQGNPLSIENVKLYDNRLIKQRLNEYIIIDYLLQLGITFEEIDSNITNCFTCIQK